MSNMYPDSGYVMLVDVDSCSGCHACSVACKAEHRAPIGQFRTRVQSLTSGTYPQVKRRFVPTLCQHCVDAPCLSACPAGAIVRTVDGQVLVEENRCIGSGDCVPACPYGAIFRDDEGTAKKCDFCEERVADGDNPACVATCPTDALHFGRVDDEQIVQQLQLGDYEMQWVPAGRTQPRVYYKGLTPAAANSLSRINQDK